MKPLMLVLEGPDCTGKTTVVQRFAEEYSCATHKRVRTKDRYAMLSSIFNDINQQLMRTSVGSGDSLVVFDRWQLVSDIVYEKFCYGKDSILEPLYPVLGKVCHTANILVIYMTIDKDEMVSRFNIRGDRLRTVEEVIRVHEAYEKMFSKTGIGQNLPHVLLDVTGMSPDSVYERIKDIINANGGNV
jgi:thymidylate kinase